MIAPLLVDELPVVQHALAGQDAPAIARSLQTVLAVQRRILDAADTIEPWWAELGWQTIDRLAGGPR
jgi:hypothetical protein